MVIINQDRDKTFRFTHRVLFKPKIYIVKQYFNGQLMGWNIMGNSFICKEEVLLGTYDEDEAKQIVDEINKLLKSGAEHYVMPEAALDPEDYMAGVDIYD